ncbi:hypothetical protein [Natronomonas gomsonensis]|jgi:hypothetical protein|uniref:DUF7521 family protein n=1 Tax=Natronomonas gomsonensis TaxID=1046043 RepID=UPI0015BE28C0|nr:hypothetical protein [Natronomonas gomsonensis]
MVDILQGVLILMRLVLFGLSLGLTLISFQAYSKRGSDRLQYAFIGFAFISMGVAMTNLTTQVGVGGDLGRQLFYLQIAETVPFIVGFAMIYMSLYR